MDKFTFRGLMAQYEICIPIIQRDYAQGRRGEFSVRTTFLNEIRRHFSQKQEMPLDFIYGIVSGGEKNKKTFIPLDGQQRLTTLMLLHWYFGAYPLLDSKDQKSEFDRCVWRFDYASRRMAMSFTKLLFGSKTYERTTKPSAWLEKHGMIPAWKCDPTVSGMLTMLDEIYSVFKTDFTQSDLDLLTFYVHFCDGINADETYLKINARGEPLTQWENIKSILDKRADVLCKSSDEEIKLAAQTWKKRVNGDWSDWIERLMPEIEFVQNDLRLSEYRIALSVAICNAAFRNIVDAAAMLNVDKNKLHEKCKALADPEKTVGEILLGNRSGAGTINNVDGVVRRYLREFMLHNATYEDYRDQRVFTDDAFVTAVDMFNSLDPKGNRYVYDAWTQSRGRNCLWCELLGHNDQCARVDDKFLSDFLFSGVKPDGRSVGNQGDANEFLKWCSDQHSDWYSSPVYTYNAVLRIAVLAKKKACPLNRSRALNFLDFYGNDDVNADNFVNINTALENLLAAKNDDIGDAIQSLGKAKAYGNVDQQCWENFVKNECVKCAEYIRAGCSATFIKAERVATKTNGVIYFCYDSERDSFDVDIAKGFNELIMNNDNPVLDDGFCRLIRNMILPASGIDLPQRVSGGGNRFWGWRFFLLQDSVANAGRLELSPLKEERRFRDEDWSVQYLKFIGFSGEPYAWIYKYDDNVYLYNNKSKITVRCYRLTYSTKELRTLETLSTEKHNPYVRFRQAWIRDWRCEKHVEVSSAVLDLSDLDTHELAIRIFDDEGSFREMPVRVSDADDVCLCIKEAEERE